MRSSRVVGASDSQCRSRNCPPSILRQRQNLRGGRWSSDEWNTEKNWVYILNIFSTTNILYSSFTSAFHHQVSPLNESILVTKSLCVNAPVVTPRQNDMQMMREIKLTLLQGGVMKRSVSLPSPPAAYVPPERKSTHQKPAYSAHPLEVNFSWSFSWKQKTIQPMLFKDIVQPFEFGGLTRLIRSGIINWRPDMFLYNLYEKSINPFTAA